MAQMMAKTSMKSLSVGRSRATTVRVEARRTVKQTKKAAPESAWYGEDRPQASADQGLVASPPSSNFRDLITQQSQHVVCGSHPLTRILDCLTVPGPILQRTRLPCRRVPR